VGSGLLGYCRSTMATRKLDVMVVLTMTWGGGCWDRVGDIGGSVLWWSSVRIYETDMWGSPMRYACVGGLVKVTLNVYRFKAVVVCCGTR